MIQWTPIYNYSWEALKQDAKNLSQQIGQWRFKFILAITKGGLIPAYFIADNLNIKVIKTICLSSYKNKWIQWPIVHHAIDGFMEDIKHPNDWLIVDDLSDTGFTLEYIKRKYPKVKTAVLLQKKTWGIKADYFAQEVDNIWIKFPHEQ